MMYVLFESASGYGLFEMAESEGIALKSKSVQEAVTDLSRFGKICKLKAFAPFRSAIEALENINCISEGILHDYLRDFLEANLPKAKAGKKAKYTLGIADSKLGTQLSETLNVQCEGGDLTKEIIRGIRLHFEKMITAMRPGDYTKAQLGLSHSYSRSKVKFNVNRVDNMIIQAICLLDQLDKDINTFSMRAKEWNSYCFPELAKVVADNYLYAKTARFVGDKNKLTEEHLEELEELVGDTAKAKQVLQASRASMGMDVSETDRNSINAFLDRVISLSEYRMKLNEYLCTKMDQVSPNLAKLIGPIVGARLISQAGSLTNLAKAPASTVQILGAEKALFRALKTKGNTPKYGLIYHSTFIGRAAAKNKGRISRFLANKCTIASRIDCFSDVPTSKFGEVMRDQVEERLAFYETGVAPQKNLTVMQDAAEEVRKENGEVKPTKKRSRDEDSEEKPSKKIKKEKKSKKTEDKKEKKSKKSKKSKKE
ncbi:nucleolar protein 56 [Sphaeroforma arctica JP610]|uniref:Nucleolar protein 56 n=1 Tax=Sphaeroforma arctica JP610 TaxID=667725 RepID=A0A0L0FWE8_9EUKA|nr:nucleolar protein 56 [Sphaeroforma arctica JP610]KNC80278.1 nucleolar protein 56 [Sphaeroforma arctica JP610]|eukprot:XP_014154180.1 nucleolar protein 56 [Sphaeroforma arctica JP610]